MAGRRRYHGSGTRTLMMSNTRAEVLSGRRAWSAQVRFRAHLVKWFLQKKRYPLVLLSASKGGLLKTFQIQKDLRLRKVIRHGDRLLFSLSLPFFPSEVFERMAAKGGLNIAASGTPLKTQVEDAILSITRFSLSSYLSLLQVPEYLKAAMRCTGISVNLIRGSNGSGRFSIE